MARMYPNLFRIPDWVPLLGGEMITSFGVMLFLAFLTAGLLHSREMKRVGLDPERAWDLLFAAVIGGIVGAKLYYVIEHLPRLGEDPLELLLSRGGLVWYGGLLGGVGLTVLQARRLRLPIPRLGDTIAAPVALAYAVGRVGCFLVGDDYGVPTGSFLGVRFPDGTPPTRVAVLESQYGIQVDPELVARFGEVVPVHPTQLYEVGLSLVIFAVLWKLRDRRYAPGWLFTLWLALAGAERFAVEFLRIKTDRLFGPFTVAQLVALVLVMLGLLGVVRLARPPAARPAARAGAPR